MTITRMLTTLVATGAVAAWSAGGTVLSQDQTQTQQAVAQGKSIASETLKVVFPDEAGGLAAPKVKDVLLAEGDSWFSYPGLDVISALESRLSNNVRYVAFSAAKAGDTLEAMAYDAEELQGYAREFKKVKDAGRQGDVKAILLSGGGNDLAGREFHMLLNHARSLAGTASPLDDAMSKAFVSRLRRDLVSLISTSAAFSSSILARTDIPILIHGYAPPVPDGRPFLIGWPLPGPWLQPGFAAKGFQVEETTDLQRNTTVMSLLIRDFNDAIKTIPDELKNVATVRYVDVRPVLKNDLASYKNDWANELHPKDKAFIGVAEEFQKRILK
jgi:hypothetical protein